MKKGFKFSEEYKAAKRQAYRGFRNSGTFKKGNIPWDKGIKRPKFSKEWLSNLAESHRGNRNAANFERTKEYKESMAIATKGIPKSSQMKERVRSALTGKPKSEEHKNKMRGENNWNWNPDRKQVLENCGGRSNAEYKWWTKKVKERDSGRCRIANDACSGNMVAHHILSYALYPELRYEINNGITLCHFHHPKKRQDEVRLSPFFQELVAKIQ